VYQASWRLTTLKDLKGYKYAWPIYFLKVAKSGVNLQIAEQINIFAKNNNNNNNPRRYSSDEPWPAE